MANPMRPDYRRPRNGLLLIAAPFAISLILGVLIGRATAPVPSLSCPSVVEAAECHVERCERTIEVQVFKDALQCRRDESVCKVGNVATCCDLGPEEGVSR